MTVILMSCVDKFLKVVSCSIGSAVHRKLPEVMQRSTKIVLNKHNGLPNKYTLATPLLPFPKIRTTVYEKQYSMLWLLGFLSSESFNFIWVRKCKRP